MALFSRALNRLKRAARGAVPPAEILRQSALVDADLYRSTYKEVEASGRDPVEDYLENGVSLGRNPNALFDTAWYLDRYPDVRAAGVNPLRHFVETGASEGRDPGPGFSTRFYLSVNPSVAAADLNPLAHYLQNGRDEGRLPRPRDALDAYEATLRTRRTGADQFNLDHVHFPLHGRTGSLDPEGRPLPPLDLAQRIGAPDFEEFESIGRGTRQTILRCLPPGFDFRGARVLDFGCGVSRVLRHFSEEAKHAEFWGCDIDGPSIRWDVENLSPPFRFFQLSEVPTIPLEDSSFDLVYAISVFAHIHVDWHHWLMEVRRILKPGGTFFVTFMAQTPFEEMLGQSYWGYAPNFGKYVKNPFADWNAGGPMAFHSPDWIKAFWGSLFDIEFIALDGLLDYQSICLMRKPDGTAPMATEIPVLKNSTSQAFDPDAVGRITASFDQSRGYRESYGIEAWGATDVTGWIVFRGDRPAQLDLLVDDRKMDGEVAFEGGRLYRDWDASVQTAFWAHIDLSRIEPGIHRLEVRIHSAGGKTHAMSIPLIVRAPTEEPARTSKLPHGV